MTRLSMHADSHRSSIIRVWPVRLDAPPDDLANQTLSVEEQLRAQRFHQPSEHDRFVVGHASLRRLLAREMEQSPAQISIALGPWGKPYVAHAPALRFNLSRSVDLAVIAISYEHEVGVDVEQLRPIPDALALARAYFSLSEREALSACASHEMHAAFLRVWTRKEAVVKGTGRGLSLPLESFDVPASPDDALIHTEADGRWLVHTFSAAPGYLASVATPNARARCEVQPAL
ncbi:MAG TPA: 4'-phosphopantetheinyl transferase superfamily protein [Gemmatimonadaceae bacterium]